MCEILTQRVAKNVHGEKIIRTIMNQFVCTATRKVNVAAVKSLDV